VPKPVSTPRIIGGRYAGDAPWAVQVAWDDAGFECSGTSVAAQWVLTARHCVNPAGMTVLIGAKQLGDGTKAVVDNKIVDPVGDLALLHLAEPVSTTYVTLADEDPTVGAINEIYGWGKTDPTSGPSDQLKSARVKVTSVDCQDGQGGRAICSTGITGTAFNGDSGGPEMASGVEVGVCSTGDDDAKTQQYASVAANRDWIREVANV
jgi:secreted trypsin-like serine protease